DLVRRMSRKMDLIPMGGMWWSCKRQGMSDEATAREVFKFFGRYGDPDDTSAASGEDRPLPVELRDRINTYMEQWKSRPENLREELTQSSSFNAWIRKKLKLGSR